MFTHWLSWIFLHQQASDCLLEVERAFFLPENRELLGFWGFLRGKSQKGGTAVPTPGLEKQGNIPSPMGIHWGTVDYYFVHGIQYLSPGRDVCSIVSLGTLCKEIFHHNESKVLPRTCSGGLQNKVGKVSWHITGKIGVDLQHQLCTVYVTAGKLSLHKSVFIFLQLVQ